MSKKLLVANWKMNLRMEESSQMASSFAKLASRCNKSEVWIAPAFPAIAPVAQAVKGSGIHVGAQNVHWEETGSFTGEVSATMLKECGADFAIVGHSERRNLLSELPPIAARRALGALKLGMQVIFCIGETLSKRKSEKTFQVIDEQLSPCLDGVSDEEAERLIIAYEPVWAIGTGNVATRQQILEAHEYVARVWDEFIPDVQPRILYGGSVSAENFAEILTIPVVHGGLIGGASLSVEKFEPLISLAER